MFTYETNPEEIYRQSFRTIRAEADLGGFSRNDAMIAERMIHACGQVDLVDDLVITAGARRAGTQALANRVPIFCDSAMVAAGLSEKITNVKVVKIAALETMRKARDLKTTRSAAQVDLWGAEANGAIVLIGNAPTALFRLLELEIRPALLIACPVGFVGAQESKDALIKIWPDFPFVTLKGRRGGTPMTAAALNACALTHD